MERERDKRTGEKVRGEREGEREKTRRSEKGEELLARRDRYAQRSSLPLRST